MDLTPEDIAADIDSFYAPGVSFAESFTSGAGDPFYGVVDDEHYPVATGDGESVVVASQTILRTRDADAVAAGGVVIVRGEYYSVIESMPDGNGETVHQLQRLFYIVPAGNNYMWDFQYNYNSMLWLTI